MVSVMRQPLSIAVVAILIMAGRVAAQQPDPPSQPDPAPAKVTWKDRLKEHLKEPDQAGGMHLTEHWAVAFGGIKQGSGIGAGPAWSTKFTNGGFVQAKAVISIRNFRLLQVRYDTPSFLDGRAIVISRIRWHHAPEVRLYALGPDSPDRRVDYDERRSEISSRLEFKPRPSVRVIGAFGLERFRTRADRLDQLTDPASLALGSPPPGLGTHPMFARLFGSLGHDTRLTPDYTRSGHFFEVALHGYNDVQSVEDSFGRFEATAEQHVPTHEGKGVISVSARTWLSLAKGARSVPFYLTPTLGGGNLLRAYPTYRFRDRHAMILVAQYRWAVHRFVDIAGTYEAGKVAPEVSGLNFDNIAQSIALGVRTHTGKASLVRVDVAYGREGFVFSIGLTASGGGP
jgi:hypothetical protein